MRRVRFAGAAEPVRPPVTHDAWGSDEENGQQDQQQAARTAQQNCTQRQQQKQQRLQAPILSQIERTKNHLSEPVVLDTTATAKQAGMQLLHEGAARHQHIPSLHKLCLGVLGRYVTVMVEQLDRQLSWLPADVKAALLAVARRRGELTGSMLSALADVEWTQLDLAGCSRLYAADVLAVACGMPNIRVLDVTGFEHLAAGGWKQLAVAWPNLTILRMGGTEAANKEALKALPHILPGIAQPIEAAARKAACAGMSDGSATDPIGSCNGSSNSHESGAAVDSWEDVVVESVDEEGNCCTGYNNNNTNTELLQQQEHQHSSGKHSSSVDVAPAPLWAAADCRLKQLRVLVWPDVPQEAIQLVQQRCPRVVINPIIKPDVVTGQLPPAEVHPGVPLDQPYMELVGPQALKGVPQDAALLRRCTPIVHIADKFRAAYIEQAARLRDKERRLRKAEQRKQLKSSHALRTLHAWLDEPA